MYYGAPIVGEPQRGKTTCRRKGENLKSRSCYICVFYSLLPLNTHKANLGGKTTRILTNIAVRKKGKTAKIKWRVLTLVKKGLEIKTTTKQIKNVFQ